MHELAPKHLINLSPYIAGKSLIAAKKQYGLNRFIKLASNENPLGASPLAIEAILKAHIDYHYYPDSNHELLKENLLGFHQSLKIDKSQIIIGNGSNEIINLLTKALCNANESVLFGWPSFISYSLAAKAQALKFLALPLKSDFNYDLNIMAEFANNPNINPKIIFIANPNNPTGTYITSSAMEWFIRQIPAEIVVIIDEAYFEYVTKVDYQTCLNYALNRPRTMILRTFSKIYGLAALRLGYGIGDKSIVDILDKIRDPFSVNSIAQIAGIAALNDIEHVAKSRQENMENREFLFDELIKYGFDITPSVANFLLIHNKNLNMQKFIELLMKKGIIIRPLLNYDLPDSARITIGTKEQNMLLLSSLHDMLNKK